jgi:hypothetical protein
MKNSDFLEYFSDTACGKLRQICDLTMKQSCRFVSLSYRSEIALFRYFSYADRCGAFEDKEF